MLRSDAPTIIRGLPKFVRSARGLILDLLLARADTANGYYHVSKVHVIKHVDGRGGGGGGREKEREREGGSNKTQFNRDARRDRSSLITHAYATTCKT